MAIKWTGMEFTNATDYTVSIRAVNYAGLVGGEVSDDFSVEMRKPFHNLQGKGFNCVGLR